jgi:hypothetical protein
MNRLRPKGAPNADAADGFFAAPPSAGCLNRKAHHRDTAMHEPILDLKTVREHPA